jgi:hypothetical protein
MFIRIRIRPQPSKGCDGKTAVGQYSPRKSSFIGSFGLHCLGVAFVVRLSTDRPSETPILDEIIGPNAQKITWYDFRKKLPDVATPRQINASPHPQGIQFSQQTVIAQSLHPTSSQQYIWSQAPKLKLSEDLRVPDLIASMTSPIWVGPPEPRRFIPPPQVAAQPRLAIPEPIIEAPGPSIGASPRIGLPTPDIAIVNLHPYEKPGSTLPDGERPGEFSKAPTQGVAGTNGTSGSLAVPNLSISSDRTNVRKPSEIPAIKDNRKAILYSETVRSVPVSTLSVPLRPASRMIPRIVDLRFQGRYVYTIVIPIENFAAYRGDWILWFAERNQKPEENPLMRAPVPFRKRELVDNAPPGNRTEQRVQLAATITKDGRVEQVSMLTMVVSAVQQRVIDDIESWEFKPATRDGIPVDVEAVLEIPFNLVLESAK